MRRVDQWPRAGAATALWIRDGGADRYPHRGRIVPSFRPIKEINTEGTVVEISVTAAADGPAPSVAPTFSIGNDPKVPSVVVGDSSSQPPQWLIVAAHLSTEGVAYFWGPEFSGYTANLDKAGRYTEQEAKNREVWSERMEVAVTLAEAEAARFPAVRDDDAHVWFLRRFPDHRKRRKK